MPNLFAEAWTHFNGSNTDPAEFLQEFHDVRVLALPEPEIARIVAVDANTKLTTVSGDMNVAYTYSGIGRALFSSGMKGLAKERLASCIDESLKDLAGKAVVSEETLLETIRKGSEQVIAIAGIETLSGKRVVEMTYRGIPFKYTVGDPCEQLRVALRSAVRASATESGVLQPSLPGETALAQAPEHKLKVEPSVVSKAKRARAKLVQTIAVQGGDDASGDTVLVPLNGTYHPACSEESNATLHIYDLVSERTRRGKFQNTV
eukprot:6488676-Amphidinium_carterae.3